MPVLFVSHGAPPVALLEDDYTRSLFQAAQSIPLPRAILVVSSHRAGGENLVMVSAGQRTRLLYDFRGFQEELYEMTYPCPGAPDLAVTVGKLLAQVGISAVLSPEMGFDHAVWIPLRIAFPRADIPVVQVTLPSPAGPETIMKMGKALSILRDQGVLLVGSGSVVHNVNQLQWSNKYGKAAGWALEFHNWVKEKNEAGDLGALKHFKSQAPNAIKAHPTDEHIKPFFFALGARRDADFVNTVYDGFQYGTLSMYSFLLESPSSLKH